MPVQPEEKATKTDMKNGEFCDEHLSSRLITQNMVWPADSQSF